jgi:hypothetical protein
VFTRRQAGNEDIFEKTPSASAFVNLTAGRPGDDREPVFSPDGTKVVFSSKTIRGDFDVFTMSAADGSNQADLSPVSTVDDTDPDWQSQQFCSHQRATIVGSLGDDVIGGTKSADAIVSFEGHDRISSLGGRDRVCSGPGPDKVKGGGGLDRLFGGSGKDRLFGGGDFDRLIAGSGRDLLVGGGPYNRLIGGTGKDRIRRH